MRARVRASERDEEDAVQAVFACKKHLRKVRARQSLEKHRKNHALAAQVARKVNALMHVGPANAGTAVNSIIADLREIQENAQEGRAVSRRLVQTLADPNYELLPADIRGREDARMGAGANLMAVVDAQVARIRGAGPGAPAAGAGAAGPVVVARAAAAPVGAGAAAPAADARPRAVVNAADGAARIPPAGRGAPCPHVAGANRLRDGQDQARRADGGAGGA